MKINRRAFIKRMNWTLAGILGMLGFANCTKVGMEEYGTPHADYTIKGAVVNKSNGKPIAGIRVGYVGGGCIDRPYPMYGTMPTPFGPKAHVITNAKGEFILKDSFIRGEIQMNDNKPTLPVSVVDEKNGLFNPEYLQVDFSNAQRKGKAKGWYDGEYIVTQNVEMTEIND